MPHHVNSKETRPASTSTANIFGYFVSIYHPTFYDIFDLVKIHTTKDFGA
jgi:hypothetical protein